MTIVKGKVIKNISNNFYVEYEENILCCQGSTKLKLKKNRIYPGDFVEFMLEEKYIKTISARKNLLIRPAIANIDSVWLVFSAIQPEMNFGLLDRMILIMEINQIDVGIIITKIDLIDDEKLLKLKQKLLYYQKIGYRVLYSSPNQIVEIDEIVNNKEDIMFSGQTGVGKSTIINMLIPELKIKTQEISFALNRGKHTTREATFYKQDHYYIIDTPGFSSFDIPLTKEDIRDNFIDFQGLSVNCKYKNCYHDQEPKCAVKEHLTEEMIKSRHESYISLLNGGL